jgi:DNA ligase (NAD+)
VTPAELAARLRGEITRHNEAYFVHDAPTLPDADYDALVRELRELEAAHPEIAHQNSVTQTVGAPVGVLFKQVTHSVPMLSLDLGRACRQGYWR